MKKNILYAFCFCLFLFAGCSQKPIDEKTTDGQEWSSQSPIQPAQNVESTTETPSSAPTSTPDAGTVDEGQSPSSTSKQGTDAEVVEIKEKMFIQQCNDVFLNPADYSGKIIKLEGLYDEYVDEETGETYHIIYRNTPGCCGADGAIGFSFTYEGEIPEPNDWIKVSGIAEVIKTDGYDDVILHLTALEVTDQRGKEFVTN